MQTNSFGYLSYSEKENIDSDSVSIHFDENRVQWFRLMDGSSSKEQKLGSKNSAPKTDLGSCRYFNARHRHAVFPLWFFFATWNLRPNLPAESKITKAFQTNFLLMCMSDTQTRTYQKSSDREALSSSKLTTKSYCCGAYLSVNHSKSSSTPRGVGWTVAANPTQYL